MQSSTREAARQQSQSRNSQARRGDRAHLRPVNEHALVLVEGREDRSELPGTQSDSKVLQELRPECGRIHLHLQNKGHFRARMPEFFRRGREGAGEKKGELSSTRCGFSVRGVPRGVALASVVRTSFLSSKAVLVRVFVSLRTRAHTIVDGRYGRKYHLVLRPQVSYCVGRCSWVPKGLKAN